MPSKTDSIPGPSWQEYGLMYLASGCDFLRLAKRLVTKYGDMVHVKIRTQHHFYVNQPELIEKILLSGDKIWTSRPRPMRFPLGLGLITSQGALHDAMRRFMQPFFQKQAINDKTQMIEAETERLTAKWQDGQVRDIFTDMTRLALSIIFQTVFGASIEDEKTLNQIEHAAHVIHHYGHQSLLSFINLHVETIPFFGKFTPSMRARKFMDDLIYEKIASHRKSGNFEGDDLLSLLLRSQQTPEGQKYLTDKQIRDELMTMFFAGHETTASALSWTFYLLSQHPEVEQKLHNELDQVLNGRVPVVEDFPKLCYARMVINESMRLYPPVWTMARRPVRDHDFHIEGYVFPQKSMILVSPYLIHHDARYYPDPEKFDPERFSTEEEAKRPRWVYIPFGAGNRKCIGESLAWLESILIMTVVASRWRLRLVPGHRVAMSPLISLKPKYGMRMILERRTAKLQAASSENEPHHMHQVLR